MKYYAIYSIRDQSICGATTSSLLDEWRTAHPVSYLWFTRSNTLHEISSDVHSVLTSLFSEIRQHEVQWIHDSECGVTRCPRCNWSIEEDFYDHRSGTDYPYCPNCGQLISPKRP